MEGLQTSELRELLSEGVVMRLEELGPLDAAVEGDGMLDRVLLHGLPESDHGGQHVGLHLLVPLAAGRAHEDVLLDQVLDLLAANADRDDVVVTEDGRLTLHRLLERELVEGVTIDLEVVHAQHLVAATLIAALGGGHEDPLPDLDIVVVKEDGELLVAVANGLVSLVHDAQVEGELRLPGSRGQDVAALVGGEDDGQAFVLSPEPFGDLVGRCVAGDSDILSLHDHVILVGLAGRLIATHADPIDVDVVGGAFTGPDLQGLLDQGEAGDGDDDALGPEGLCQEPGREALAGTAGHDELTTGGLALGEVLQAVTDSILLVRARRTWGQDRRLIRELGPQLV